MKTSRFILRMAMTMSAIIMGVAMMHAEKDPRWVQKGTATMNAQRSNDTYAFYSFEKAYPFMQDAAPGGIELLLEFINKTYGTVRSDIDYVPLAGYALPTYNLRFTGIDGKDYEIVAQRVDEFSKVDDSYIEHPPFILYQLYAISQPNVKPVFDTYEVTEKYNSTATLMSIVPGLGQLYKGDNTKGYVIMGGEVVLVASTIAFEYKRHQCKDMIGKNPFDDSWRSKTNGWRNMRNLAIGGAVGLYIYNFIDAALTKGAPQIIVKKATQSGVSFSPYASAYDAGVAMRYTF